jgi:hypothetical protein
MKKTKSKFRILHNIEAATEYMKETTCKGSGGHVYLQHLLFFCYSGIFQNLENKKNQESVHEILQYSLSIKMNFIIIYGCWFSS